MDGDNEQQVMLSEEMLLEFPLLEKITNGFSADQQIAEGGFSVVYKVYASGHNNTERQLIRRLIVSLLITIRDCMMGKQSL